MVKYSTPLRWKRNADSVVACFVLGTRKKIIIPSSARIWVDFVQSQISKDKGIVNYFKVFGIWDRKKAA